MKRIDTPVLIVGAGPVGLMAAILLRQLGIEALLVERRAEAGRAPAAHVVNARTFEICRSAGVDMQALLAHSRGPEDAGQSLFVTRLGGDVLGSLPFERQGPDALDLTPTPLRNLAQHRFERVLHECLGEPGATFGQQWESAVQTGEGVVSSVRDIGTDTPYEIHSRYVIAADGAGSRIRNALGIEMVGPPKLQSFVMIHFSANLRAMVGEHAGILYWVCDPAAGGTFVAHDIDSEWVYMLGYDSDTESAEDYPPERCKQAVLRAMQGVPDAVAREIEIETISTWVMSAQVAERFGEGRILLAGDAAHRFPPTGGLGLNSGVQDVHGLTWRIAAVLNGWASESLLDTYEQERRPVAQYNADQSLRNASKLIEVPLALGTLEEPTTARMQATLADPAGRARLTEAIANQAEHFDMLGLQLGYSYESDAIVPDGSPPQKLDNPVREFVPSSRPGARLPHAWVERRTERGSERLSTLDLVMPGRFTLVTASPDARWAEAVDAVSEGSSANVPISLVVIGRDFVDADAHWQRVGGIDGTGALLVRPDQHVAWRVQTMPDDPAAALRSVLARVLGRAGSDSC